MLLIWRLAHGAWQVIALESLPGPQILSASTVSAWTLFLKHRAVKSVYRAGLLNRCRWMHDAFPFEAGDVPCFHTAPTFVDSLWQMLGPLLAGVPFLVLPPRVSRDPAALLQALVQHRVTHIVAVPTLLRILVQHMQRSGAKGKPLPFLLLPLCVVKCEPVLIPQYLRFPSCITCNQHPKDHRLLTILYNLCSTAMP